MPRKPAMMNTPPDIHCLVTPKCCRNQSFLKIATTVPREGAVFLNRQSAEKSNNNKTHYQWGIWLQSPATLRSSHPVFEKYTNGQQSSYSTANIIELYGNIQVATGKWIGKYSFLKNTLQGPFLCNQMTHSKRGNMTHFWECNTTCSLDSTIAVTPGLWVIHPRLCARPRGIAGWVFVAPPPAPPPSTQLPLSSISAPVLGWGTSPRPVFMTNLLTQSPDEPCLSGETGFLKHRGRECCQSRTGAAGWLSLLWRWAGAQLYLKAIFFSRWAPILSDESVSGWLLWCPLPDAGPSGRWVPRGGALSDSWIWTKIENTLSLAQILSWKLKWCSIIIQINEKS